MLNSPVYTVGFMPCAAGPLCWPKVHDGPVRRGSSQARGRARSVTWMHGLDSCGGLRLDNAEQCRMYPAADTRLDGVQMTV